MRKGRAAPPSCPKRGLVDFYLVRGILLDRPALEDDRYRDHVRWCEKQGLITVEGLTEKGQTHARLVLDAVVFEKAIQQMAATFGGHSWAQLVWVLKRRG